VQNDSSANLLNSGFHKVQGQTLSAYTDKDLTPNSVSITEIVAI